MYSWVPYRMRIVPGKLVIDAQGVDIKLHVFDAITYFTPIQSGFFMQCQWQYWCPGTVTDPAGKDKQPLPTRGWLVKVTRPLFDGINEERSNRLPSNTSIFCYSESRRIIIRNSPRMNSNLPICLPVGRFFLYRSWWPLVGVGYNIHNTKYDELSSIKR